MENMRRYKKQEMLQSINMLKKANNAVIKAFSKSQRSDLEEVMMQCQDTAILLGTYLETLGEESISLVHILEEYCENIYQMSQSLQDESICRKISKKIQKQLIQVENGINFHLPLRREVVFLPYKASMWDSLESVYLAAKEDENCDAYVIPIPYYDKNPDGTFKEEHYEAELFPEYVTITNYQEYDFEERRPDAIFIHNPYDQYNFVTSVHPFFYSSNLKQYTDNLVYIPYYATAGGMSEAQSQCIAYYYADYIVIQSEKYRKYFAEDIPDEKFLAFGSPKFDSVIRKCANPPELPDEWKAKVIKADGTKKKIYFYNTSLNGMLDNTASFLQKMEYVFKCFKGRNNVCLVWRPHPLMESTFVSMRAEYKTVYDALKKYFIESDLGIYDDTPDIANTIALCDAYIGDAGTSVTSLFGVVGKPLFILNNKIHTLPKEDDWKGVVYQTPFQTLDGVDHNKYCVTQGNKLYYSPNDDWHYKYFCDLSEYAGGGYYSRAFDYGNKIYVFPNNAQSILVVSEDKHIRKIDLKNEVEQAGAFAEFWIYETFAYLLPNRYPFLVRFDMETEKITYIEGITNFNVAVMPGNERIPAARWIWRRKMCFMNPAGTQLMCIDIDTLEKSVYSITANKLVIDVVFKKIDGEEVWLLPYEGATVTRWNIDTGEACDYDLRVEGIKSIHRRYMTECNHRFFSSMAFIDDEIIFAPFWGNKFVKLNIATGKAEEWKSPFDISAEEISPYMSNFGIGYFVQNSIAPWKYRFMLSKERKMFGVDLYTKKIKEINVYFDREDVYCHANGYGKESQWLRYCCAENVFNSIVNELEGTIHGENFNRQKQIEEYLQINASPDGNCGERVYQYIVKSLN